MNINRGRFLAMKRHIILVLSVVSAAVAASVGAGMFDTVVSQTNYFPANGVATWCYSAGAWVGCSGTGGGGGTVTITGTPANGQIAQWTSATSIQGDPLGTGLIISSGTLTTQFPVEAAKVASYQVAAGDMGYTIPFNGSSLALTIPASGFGTTILGAGQTFCAANIASTPVTITNSSGGTMYPAFVSIPPFGGTICFQGDGTSIYAWPTVTLAPFSNPFALTDGSSIAVDGSKSDNFTLTLTASGHTLANPTNTFPGQWLSFVISQDGTG